MNYQIAGAVLLALLATLLPAAVHKEHWRVFRRDWKRPRFMLWNFVFSELGTVTQTYIYPGSGTVPATGAQASAVYVQVAQVNFVDADTTATVTHNWGIGTTGAFPNTGIFMPEVILTWSSAGTAFPALAVAWTNGNTITLAKGNTSTGSGGTVVVTMRKPHSTGQ